MKKFKVALYLGDGCSRLWESIPYPVMFAGSIKDLCLEDKLPEGDVVVREFNTYEELHAYIQGASDTDGWSSQSWSFSTTEDNPSISEDEIFVGNLIKFIESRVDELDLCILDGCGTEYLIGERELRYPTCDCHGHVSCSSNNIHKVDENGNDIECEYIDVNYSDMTPYENQTLRKFLIEYIQKML